VYNALAAVPETRVLSEQAVANQDWNAAWRESIQPVRLCAGVWVSPVWRPPRLNPTDHWIRIEPKMAFGTGHHETTRLAAEGIVACAAGSLPHHSLLDIGTGSGVLCFCAALHGYSNCTGVEIDPDCSENLAENVRLNAADGAAVRFVIGTTDSITRAARFDTIVMNMIFNESAPLLGFVSKALAPGGTLVWSGILAEGRQEAVDAARGAGFALQQERVENEWWMGLFTSARQPV
jgi:ribosomal protein L11 methyltransferase